MALKDVLMAAEEIGFTQIVLPFIIIFTIVFALLQKTKVLGVDSKGNPKANYNSMVAFVVAFFALIMASTLKVIDLFTRYFVILLFIFIFIGIIASFAGGRAHLGGVIKFVGLALLLFVLLQALVMAGVLDDYTAYHVILPILVALFAAGGVIAMLSSEKEEKPEEKKKEGKKQDEIPGIEKVKEIKPKKE